MAKPQSPWLSIGRGGWSIHYPPYKEGNLNYGQGSLSHYGNTWTEHLHELAPDAIGTDTTVISEDEIVTFAVSGPLVDVSLENGLVRGFETTWVWADEPAEGRDPRFGNAGGWCYVALDVYVEICERFGGSIFNPHERARELELEAVAA